MTAIGIPRFIPLSLAVAHTLSLFIASTTSSGSSTSYPLACIASKNSLVYSIAKLVAAIPTLIPFIPPATVPAPGIILPSVAPVAALPATSSTP